MNLDSEGTDKGDGSAGSGKKHWYQVSKVHGTEGTYRLLGVDFRSP